MATRRLTLTLVAGISAALVSACISSPASNTVSSEKPRPSPAVKALIVFTTWTPDTKVTSGPEPGYKPALSSLDGHMVQGATARIDNTQTSWVIDLTFTQDGAQLLAKLTRANVAACPGDPTSGAGPGCVQRHLALWVDLDQGDIDNWQDPSYVNMVSQPFDLKCLAQGVAANCPKFISDPITLEPITGGHLAINGAFSRQVATDLAAAINATAHA